ncbi:sporulation protein [Peribacillus sp. SCS-155]|uniref:sporulation protein n=1 Tax=Peribacillus sedimenti TaxID=3115297 RepID=UPI00390642DB
MSVFNKVLASIGIGSTTVDTVLEKDTFRPGDTVNGSVKVQGGSVPQKVDEIYLTINTTYVKEHDDRKFNQVAAINRIRINEPFEIQPNENRDIPFTFTLPLETPVTSGKTKVWVSTGLDIKNAVDPTDEDFIKVEPNQLVSATFSALADLGFKLRNANCEEAPYRFRNKVPFVQEFEFVPYSGSYRGRLDELEVLFFLKNKDEAEVIFEVDRRAKGLAGLFAEALDADETLVRSFINTSDIPSLKGKLDNLISRYV